MSKKPIALIAALTLLVVAALPTHEADAKGRRGGVKKLAMQRFGVDSREVKVIASAKGTSSGAVIVRLQNADVPVCHLVVLDAPPKRATKIVKTFRARVCAAYDKDARKTKLSRVQLTNRIDAWQAFIYSVRADALAKGAETRRLWALYTDEGAGSRDVFQRVSTSFSSKANSAVNSAEICEPPSFPVGDEPTTLTLSCKNEAKLESRTVIKDNTYRYKWGGSRFEQVYSR